MHQNFSFYSQKPRDSPDPQRYTHQEVPTASSGHHVASFHSNKKAGRVLSWLAPPEVFVYRLLLLRFPERIVHFCIATVDHSAAYPQLLFSKKR